MFFQIWLGKFDIYICEGFMKITDTILAKLDYKINFSVRLVKVADNLMSKKYGHRSPPGLGYFRKKDYVKYDGKLIFIYIRVLHNTT